MKKTILTLSAALLACVSLSAQSIVNNPDNKAYFGLRLGGDITCPGKVTSDFVGIDVYNNGGGFEIGGVYNVPIIANLYVEPGLKLYYDTYSMKKEFVELRQDDIIFDGVSFKKFGMRIPVMAGYHFDFADDIRVSAFTGPELEIGFTAKEYVTGRNIDISGSVYGEDGGMRRVNLLWGIGAGVTYQHYYFGVSGGIGLLNMYSDSEAKFHESRVTFSLGYNF